MNGKNIRVLQQGNIPRKVALFNTGRSTRIFVDKNLRQITTTQVNKGGLNEFIIDYRNHSINIVGTRFVCLQPRRAGTYSPGACSDTDNNMAVKGSLQSFLGHKEFVLGINGNNKNGEIQ